MQRMVYCLSISSSKAISISLNELHNVNKNQLELLIKGLMEGLILQVQYLFPSYLQKGCNCWPGNAAQKVIRDQLLNPGDLYNL